MNLTEEVTSIWSRFYVKMEVGFPPHFLSRFSALPWADTTNPQPFLFGELQPSEALWIFYKERIIMHDEEVGPIFTFLRWLPAVCR